MVAEPVSPDSEAVRALCSLSVFGADQAGAYREHFSHIREVLGAGVKTKLTAHMEKWVRDGRPGVIILTGNAGTGKTAVAEAFCGAFETSLPSEDTPHEVAPGRIVVKDLSGIPTPEARLNAIETVLASASASQALVCANEGVLRNAFRALHEGSEQRLGLLDRALMEGAAEESGVLVINLNRQRPTAPTMWNDLIEFLTNEKVWSPCSDCPHNAAGSMPGDCPMQSNANSLRSDTVREGMRLLFSYCAGKTVITLRDVLSLLAWSIVGNPTYGDSRDSDAVGLNCALVKARVKDLGAVDAYDARHAYFSLLFGAGLPFEAIERSPLLGALQELDLGGMADLEVDLWLRDAETAPEEVRAITGEADKVGISGRYQAGIRMMGFKEIGATASTSEDTAKVDMCLSALCDPKFPVTALWRRRVFFETPSVFGGLRETARRLISARYFPDLLELAERCAANQSSPQDLQLVVRGLNKVVTGFPSVAEGLIVPENASLFSRDPGSYLPAKPGVVHSTVPFPRLLLRVPDRGLVTTLLDVDHIEVEMAVKLAGPADGEAVLRIGPDIFEAILESLHFDGPVGQGRAEMAEIRDFYDKIASSEPAWQEARIADPGRSGLAPIRLPEA